MIAISSLHGVDPDLCLLRGCLWQAPAGRCRHGPARPALCRDTRVPRARQGSPRRRADARRVV